MLTKIIRIVAPITIFVGTIIIAMAVLTGTGTAGTVIEEKQILYNAGSQVWVWNYYTFDVAKYLRNIQQSLQLNQLNDLLPSMPSLKTAPGKWEVAQWLKYIANFMLVYLINWLIYITNWLLIAPLKLILYPLNIIFGLLGINTSDADVINLIKKLYQINIPLIPDFY